MWRGYSSVQPSPLSVVSLGRSSQSIHSTRITSHYQCGWIITPTELECTVTHLNGSQFRQVYSITHITINHSQTQHENNNGMPCNQRRVIWEKACLVITLCEREYSSTPMMECYGMHYHPFEWKSIQASLVNQSHHYQSLSNTTREHSWNALLPVTSDLREGISSHHSLQMRVLFNSNEA